MDGRSMVTTKYSKLCCSLKLIKSDGESPRSDDEQVQTKLILVTASRETLLHPLPDTLYQSV